MSAVIEDVLRRTAQICKELDDLRRITDYVTKLPDVTALWLSDPQYLDAESGGPIPLPFRGRKSFSGLIRRVFPRGEIESIAQSLLQSGSVVRKGRFFYATKNYLSFAEEALLAQVHSLDSVGRLLATIQHNVASRDSALRLLERSALVSSVPVSALPAIHEEIRRELGPALNRLDTYIRQYQVRGGSEPTTSVGVNAFASEDPLMTGKEPSSTGKTRRRQRMRA